MEVKFESELEDDLRPFKSSTERFQKQSTQWNPWQSVASQCKTIL